MVVPRALAQSRHLIRTRRLPRPFHHHAFRQAQGRQEDELGCGQPRGGADGAGGDETTLPAPGQGEPVTLDVSGHGTAVKLGELGPLVVNADGTTGRVNNWAEMTAMEKETTLRLLSKRNKARLEALQVKGQTSTSDKDTGHGGRTGHNNGEQV